MHSSILGAHTCVVWALLAAPACGSDDMGEDGAADDGSGDDCAFEPATLPTDVCTMLTLADIETILPSALLADPDPPVDTANLWVRSCSWKRQDQLESVDLVIYGATTSAGLQGLAVLAQGPGNGTKEPVDGLGEAATFWTNAGINTLGLIARQGSYAVDVTAYFIEPPPTKEPLVPLVGKALDAL